MLITAIPTDPCQFPTADFINKLSVVNKQDYARLHNFELHISSEIDHNIIEVRVKGSWSQVLRRGGMANPESTVAQHCTLPTNQFVVCTFLSFLKRASDLLRVRVAA